MADNKPYTTQLQAGLGLVNETKTLLDPARIDASGLTTVDWFEPSPDGKRVAYGTYRAGDENTTLRLMEVETGRVLPLEIRDELVSVPKKLRKVNACEQHGSLQLSLCVGGAAGVVAELWHYRLPSVSPPASTCACT